MTPENGSTVWIGRNESTSSEAFQRYLLTSTVTSGGVLLPNRLKKPPSRSEPGRNRPGSRPSSVSRIASNSRSRSRSSPKMPRVWSPPQAARAKSAVAATAVFTFLPAMSCTPSTPCFRVSERFRGGKGLGPAALEEQGVAGRTAHCGKTAPDGSVDSGGGDGFLAIEARKSETKVNQLGASRVELTFYARGKT